MALFGKSNQLVSLLKKLKTTSRFNFVELDEDLEKISADPEFKPLENLWMLVHPDEKVRDFIGGQLRSLHDPSVVDVVIGEMIGKEPEIRGELASLAVNISIEKVVAQLGRLMVSKEPKKREAALDLIDVNRNLNHFIGHLKTALRDPQAKIRHRAVKILSREANDPAVFLIFRALINDDDPTVRHIVIQALASDPQPDIIEPFFERLPMEELQTKSVIMRALKLLARRSQSEIEKRLLPILADENTMVRNTAAKLLSELPDKTSVLRAFLIHCRGLAVWLRERSIESISRISNDMIEPLITLMQDKDDDVRINAMVMAGKAEDPRIIPVVKSIFLSDSDWWIRSMAADILGNFQREDITNLLLSRLDNPELQYSVVSVLGKQHNRVAYETLLKCLKTGKKGIQKIALESLKNFKDQKTMEVIAQTAVNDPELSVREKAFSILEEFGPMSLKVRKEIAQSEKDEFFLEGPVSVDPGSGISSPLELEMVNEELRGHAELRSRGKM